MATVVARIPPLLGRSGTPPPHLTINKSVRGTPAAVPNKHIPICSPGPRPVRGLETPPDSPPRKNAFVETTSLTYPPDAYPVVEDDPKVYSIDARGLSEALDHLSTQPLPDPKLMFPWLHGLHAENHLQLAFFVARCRSLRKIPKCFRGITVVKAGGDLSSSKLKGAISPEELLVSSSCAEEDASFIDIDPREGFSVRNFQIQPCKIATLSDIVVYGDERTSRDQVLSLARRISAAQRSFKEVWEFSGVQMQTFNTFVVSGECPLLSSLESVYLIPRQDSFDRFQSNHPDLVAIDANGNVTGNVVDFCKRSPSRHVMTYLPLESLLGAIGNVHNVKNIGD